MDSRGRGRPGEGCSKQENLGRERLLTGILEESRSWGQPQEVIKDQLLTRALSKPLPHFKLWFALMDKTRKANFIHDVTIHSTLTLFYGMLFFSVSYGRSDTALISSSIPIWLGRGSINITLFCLQGLWHPWGPACGTVSSQRFSALMGRAGFRTRLARVTQLRACHTTCFEDVGHCASLGNKI